MPTNTTFAYNSGGGITGTTQVGTIAVGTPTVGFVATGKSWRLGPDEDLGYVIAYTASPPRTAGGGTEVIAVNDIAYKRSTAKTEASFILLANKIGNQTFASGSAAKTWLNANGYWTSYVPFVSTGLILNYDMSNSSSYPGSGTTVTDLQGNSNATLSGSPTYSFCPAVLAPEV